MNKTFVASARRAKISGLLAVLLSACLAGCAIMNRNNTPLLNLVEDNLWPDSTAGRIAAFPVVFPVGLCAAFTDAFVVHPVCVADDSVRVTGDALWDNWEWDDKYMTECAVLPWRAVATPVVFTTVFLARSAFDIPPYEPYPTKPGTRHPAVAQVQQEQESALARAMASFESELDMARALLDQGRSDEALAKATELLATVIGDTSLRDRASYLFLTCITDLEKSVRLVVLEASWKAGRVREITVVQYADLLTSRFAEKAGSILTEMSASADPVIRWTAYSFVTAVPLSHIQPWCEDKEWPVRIVGKALADPDPLVRCALLASIAASADGFKVADFVRQLRTDLKRLATQDPDPIIRALAEQLINAPGAGS